MNNPTALAVNFLNNPNSAAKLCPLIFLRSPDLESQYGQSAFASRVTRGQDDLQNRIDFLKQWVTNPQNAQLFLATFNVNPQTLQHIRASQAEFSPNPTRQDSFLSSENVGPQFQHYLQESSHSNRPPYNPSNQTRPMGQTREDVEPEKGSGYLGTSLAQSSSGNHAVTSSRLRELLHQIDPDEDMDPEVEEILLEMADDFIDNVVSLACKLAKHRGSDFLEVRDLQLPIDHMYNIRVPGFVDSVRENAVPVPKPTKAAAQTASDYQNKVAAVKKAQREAGAR